jgi:hypothetical protein
VLYKADVKKRGETLRTCSFHSTVILFITIKSFRMTTINLLISIKLWNYWSIFFLSALFVRGNCGAENWCSSTQLSTRFDALQVLTFEVHDLQSPEL